MESMASKLCLFIVLGLLWCFQTAIGIRFVIDREECFSHSVSYTGDNVQASFVVIKADTPWHYNNPGVDLVVKGPSGEQLYDSRDRTSDKFEFVASQNGLHSFCFTNKSPYHETIDFDLHIHHYFTYDQHAKDEHFDPLMVKINELETYLYNIQFNQHYLEAQAEQQIQVNKGMSRRAVQKAVIESVVLVGASLLQVYLLRRLFERKLSITRV